jgi:hypothetical protein
MAGYIVHFSRKSGEIYSRLEDYLSGFNTWCCLSSNADTWIVFSNMRNAAASIRDGINQVKPEGTFVYVLKWDMSENAWYASDKVGKWLNAILN